jgi:hypothetical protein
MNIALLRWCEWLADTPGSIAIHEGPYPLVESVHVLTLCMFVGLAAMIDLRLLGVTMRRVPVSEVAHRLLPWTVAAFAVMVISGVLLVYATPVRSYQSIFFRFKMVMLLLAGLNVWVFHSGIYRRVADWDLDPVPPRSARVAGTLSLILWALIVLSGRMIAYNWFDCYKPQSPLVTRLAGCVPDDQVK